MLAINDFIVYLKQSALVVLISIGLHFCQNGCVNNNSFYEKWDGSHKDFGPKYDGI